MTLKKPARTRDPFADDPLMAEIRRTRLRLWKQGGSTVEGLLDLVYRRSGRSATAPRDRAAATAKPTKRKPRSDRAA